MQQPSKRVSVLLDEGRHHGSVLHDGRLLSTRRPKKTTAHQDNLEIRFPRSYLPSQQVLRSAARSSRSWDGM